jgi:hypothetical protein
MAARLYVITTESGHLWLVRDGSEHAALRRWEQSVERGEAEPAVSVGRPKDREQVAYLRFMGQADA